MALTDRPTIRVNCTEDLLALIPFLLGFHPDDSLVLIAIEDSGIPVTARLNLPTSDEPLAQLPAALDALITNLKTRAGVSVVLVGYGPAAQVQAAVDAAADALHGEGIRIHEMLRVADGRFWRLDRADPTGTRFEPTASPAAATAVYAGLVALPDRGALADTLAPVTGLARGRMVAATDAAAIRLAEQLKAILSGTVEPAGAMRTQRGLALQKEARNHLNRAYDSYRGGVPVNDDHAATLTVLLELPSIRDFAARRTSREPWQIDMWTDLVRRAEPAFTVAPATLLALCALQAGLGVLANIAIDRAVHEDPTDEFAQLLALAIAAGIDPDTVAALLAE